MFIFKACQERQDIALVTKVNFKDSLLRRVTRDDVLRWVKIRVASRLTYLVEE